MYVCMCVCIRQREALMEEQRRAARKREAKDQLMVRFYVCVYVCMYVCIRQHQALTKE